MKKQKPISSLNLKKCSKVKKKFKRLGLISWIALGAVASSASEIPPLQDLTETLKTDLKSQKGTSFQSLSQSWEKKYGTQAFGPLIHLASDHQLEDAQRYVALMSATKLGGTHAQSVISLFLKDPSWMLRSAAIRILSGLSTGSELGADLSHSQALGLCILPLLRDPALVVRAEAVEAIQNLKPRGGSEALLTALEDHQNYHAGKAQWVPQRVLLALIRLQAKGAVPRLLSFQQNPQHKNDPDFRRQISRAIAILE